MISIKPLKLRDFAALMQMHVQESQQAFTLAFEQAYALRTKNDLFYTIYDSGIVVGFFIIDKAISYSATFSQRNELGLKNLVIGAQYQRRGYAREALKKLRVYVYTINPNCPSLCITVNQSNALAINFYRQCGFIETGASYYGYQGKEVIMRMVL